MCSLHLTHPSVHTWSSGQPTMQHPGSSGLPFGAGIRTHNLGLPRVSSPTLYPLGQRMHKSLVFGDEFLAHGLHLKSHQRCSAAFCRSVKFFHTDSIIISL